MQYLGVRGHPVRVGCRKMQSERGCREKQDWKGCIQSYVKARISKMGVLPTFGGNAFQGGWSEITLERPRGASAVSTAATPLTQELQRTRKVHQHSQPDPALLTSEVTGHPDIYWSDKLGQRENDGWKSLVGYCTCGQLLSLLYWVIVSCNKYILDDSSWIS